jgi:hypothetical protein
VAAAYQADGREPGLTVQGHGRGVLLGVIPKTSIIYSSFIVTKFLN